MRDAFFPNATGLKALANSLFIAPSQRILQNRWFNGTIIACIVIAGANVGVQRCMRAECAFSRCSDLYLQLYP